MRAQLDIAANANGVGGSMVRLAKYRWEKVTADLNDYGAAVLPGLFSAEECGAAVDLLTAPEARLFSNLPEQRAWSSGDNRCFNYPLPDQIAELRSALYPFLRSLADDWNERMDVAERFPETLAEFLRTCHRNRQTVSTSMIFDHQAGQQTLLHQDVYGNHQFPL